MSWGDYKYLILHPDEDGNIITFASEELLDEILNDEYMGDVHVLTTEELGTKGLDPQRWNDYDPQDILILPLREPIKVQAVVKKWEVVKK